MEKLVLIDGNSLINRAFYANPPMNTKNGTATGAVFGFVNMLIKIINDISPLYLCVAFDMKAPTFRHNMYKEYKGTRKPMPDDLRPQIPLLKEILSLMKIKWIEKEGYEADDIIGALAKNTHIDTIIITGDRDSFQLVDNETSVYFTKRGISDLDILTNENFTLKTGLTPSQIIDLKALMGDSSDNIPGVQGVGEKTAMTLLKEYGTIENLYTHLDEIKGKLYERLINDKEICFLSKKLATIITDFDIPKNIDEMQLKFPFDNEVKNKFIELEFKSFLKKSEIFDNTDISKTNEIIEEKVNINHQIIDSIEEINNIFSSINTISIIFDKNINFYTDNLNEYEIQIKDNLFDNGVSFTEIIPCLKLLFENKNAKIIVYDKKSLKHNFESYNFRYNAEIIDISIMKYVVDFTGKDEKLIEVIEEYNLLKDSPAYSLFTLYTILNTELEKQNQTNLYYNIELPLADVLFDMENSGFKIDIDTLNDLSKKYSLDIKVIEEKIYLLAGEKFNINSTKQLADILFEKLKLKGGKKNKSGYSTNAEVLEKLENDNPIIPLIIKYRQLNKLLSTYIEGFKPLIDKNTGLIHTSFNQIVTTTGRLSSKEPNLQNIPIRDELGKEIRKFFIPRDKNHILIGADYSQIELRLLAHFSDCKKLISAYNNNEDIHTLTASEVFNVSINEVTKEMRRNAKAVNFGIIYGISEFGLAKNIKVSGSVAKEYIKSYFERYPEIKEYMNNNVEFAKKNGYVSTLLGRKRYIKEINSSNYNLRSFGERAAMNMPLQGSSADIIKIAMVNVFNRLNKEKLQSKLILQIHDELIIDAYKPEKDEIIKILTEEMEGAVKLSVPLTVETEIGETWFDAK